MAIPIIKPAPEITSWPKPLMDEETVKQLQELHDSAQIELKARFDQLPPPTSAEEFQMATEGYQHHARTLMLMRRVLHEWRRMYDLLGELKESSEFADYTVPLDVIDEVGGMLPDKEAVPVEEEENGTATSD